MSSKNTKCRTKSAKNRLRFMLRCPLALQKRPRFERLEPCQKISASENEGNFSANVGKVSLRFGERSGKRQQQNEDFFTDFHAIRLLSVCVEGRGKKGNWKKKYPTASRQIDFSQVLSALRISCSAATTNVDASGPFLHNGSIKESDT